MLMADYKTQGTITVSTKKRVAELSDLMTRIFPKGYKRQRVAEKILRIIRRDGELKAEKWKEYLEELGVSSKEFYYVIRRLKALGLIRKEGGHHTGSWRLSRQFSTALRDMADFWERWAFG